MERDTENFGGLDNRSQVVLSILVIDNKSSYSYTFEHNSIAYEVHCVNF